MKRIAALAVAALTLMTAQTALAQGSKFKIYGMAAYVAPLSESDQDVGGVTDAVKASSEFGFNFGLEFRVTPMVGLEFDYLYAKHDVEGDTSGLLGETTFQPISGTLNFHLPVANLDLYGGPTASYVNWGDLEFASGGPDAKIDAEFGFGLSAGVDVSLTSNLAATGGLRWLNLQAEPEAGGEALDVHPLFARVGVAAKF